MRCAQPNIGHNTGVNGAGINTSYLSICSSTVGKLGRLNTDIPNCNVSATTTIMSQPPNTTKKNLKAGYSVYIYRNGYRNVGYTFF